jgi:hypothetical protein
MVFFATTGQCYKLFNLFNRGELLPFNGNYHDNITQKSKFLRKNMFIGLAHA